MKQRCFNPNNSKYPRYGGRGIIVCDRWRHDYNAFYADMGPRPPGLSLDRKDNDGNYEPGNCRWATAQEQAFNRRPYKWLENRECTPRNDTSGHSAKGNPPAQRTSANPKLSRKGKTSNATTTTNQGRGHTVPATPAAFGNPATNARTRKLKLLLAGLAMAILSGCRDDGHPFGCGMSFDPEPELEEVTTRVAQRWENATGCSFPVQEGGVPVVLVDKLENSCGRTYLALRRCDLKPVGVHRIELPRENEGCMTVEAALTHEFVHAICPNCQHLQNDGIFAHPSNEDAKDIDEETLVQLCTHTACTEFNPE